VANRNRNNPENRNNNNGFRLAGPAQDYYECQDAGVSRKARIVLIIIYRTCVLRRENPDEYQEAGRVW
jgi:hypothetical protein